MLRDGARVQEIKSDVREVLLSCLWNEVRVQGNNHSRGSSEQKFVQNSDFFLSTRKAIFANFATKRA